MTNIDKAKLAYYRTFQGVFGVDKRADAAFFLRLSHHA